MRSNYNCSTWLTLQLCSSADIRLIRMPSLCAMLAAPVVLELSAGSSKYYLYTSRMSWSQAQATCRARGLHLATIYSEPLSTSLNNQIKAAAGSVSSYWIGGTDSGKAEGKFRWADGYAWAYSRWADGEPNDAGSNEDCVQVGTRDALWNDNKCGAELEFVCSGECRAQVAREPWVNFGANLFTGRFMNLPLPQS
jgi:hypothetical protein